MSKLPADPAWAAVDAALDRALDLDGPDRTAFLDSLDPPLRRAVGRLLTAATEGDPIFDRFADVVADAVVGLVVEGQPTRAPAGDAAAGMGEGARVGPYQVVDLVGEGGMGRVYRARRADGAFDRTVALKLVRHSLALAGADVADRLRRERDLLAALDHPGIARLLDGGETDDGVPFLVTEFVDGAPITAYADAHGLDVRQRARLVAEVARAVDHAHRRFVVHRDLKPSNVLVTEADGEARPVVLDFGIAKLLDEAEDDGSVAFPLTRTGMRLLTPAYAAPELYDSTATVTTAADVYGLGALLYELLTGHRPHDDAGGRAGARPVPPTTEPTRPSKVVTGPAGERAFDPGQRSRALRGDLDVICLKALHPDPSRRYGSASALASDLERYLGGRPVEARPDSAAYVVGRFVRRNRTAVVAAALALGVGLALAVVAFGRERAARTVAEAQAARAAEARRFIGDLFEAADPDLSDGPDLTARAVLVAGRTRVSELSGQPALQVDVLDMLAKAYYGLGAYATADSLYAKAAALAETALVPADPLVAELALGRSGTLYTLGEMEGAAAWARRALESPGATDDVRASARRYYASALVVQGRAEEALPIYAQAERAARTALDSVELLRVLSRTGEALRETGRLTDAAARYREALAILDAARPDDASDRIRVLSGYRDVLAGLGRVEDAVEVQNEVLALTRDTYGDAHIYVAYDLAILGSLEQSQGRAATALPLLDEAALRLRRQLPAEHVAIPRNDVYRAAALADLGRCAEAAPLARTAAPPLRAFGGWHRSTAALADAVLGRCLAEDGQAERGSALIRSALEVLAADPATSEAERATVRSWLPAQGGR